MRAENIEVKKIALLQIVRTRACCLGCPSVHEDAGREAVRQAPCAGWQCKQVQTRQHGSTLLHHAE